MGASFDYRVSFRVTHPTLDPRAIANQLGMEPEFSWKAGEPRKTPKGTPLEGSRKESYCTFEIGRGDDGELAKCLSTAVDNFQAQSEFLREIRAAGGSLMFYAFWYPNGDTGEVFATDLLRKMADIGIDLGINVYDDRAVG
jgi:hypothetical protein